MRLVALKIRDITDHHKTPFPKKETPARIFWKFGLLIRTFKQDGLKIWRVLDWYDASPNIKEECKVNDFFDIPRGCIIKAIMLDKAKLEDFK